MSEDLSKVQVAVLEQKTLDLKEIVLKLEETIEKINDVNLNITKMLAVHEERINTNEQNNGTLFAKVWEITQKIDDEKISTTAELNSLRTELSTLKIDLSSLKTKFWISAIFVLFLGFVISNHAFFKNLLELGNPSNTHLTNPPSYAMMNPR